MIVKSRNGSLRALRGRVGQFIFRTYRNGKISMYYAPTGIRSNPDAFPVHLREILTLLNLEIVKPSKKSKKR